MPQQTPLFNNSNPLTQDINNTNYNAQAAANIAGANNTAALYAAGIKAVGSLAGGAIGASDRRLKKNIRETGEKTREGIPIKTFQYRGTKAPPTFRGVIAQDVEKKVPGAVRRLPGKKAYRVVDFNALTAPFEMAKA